MHVMSASERDMGGAIAQKGSAPYVEEKDTIHKGVPQGEVQAITAGIGSFRYEIRLLRRVKPL